MNRDSKFVPTDSTCSSASAHRKIRWLSQLATLTGAGLLAISSVLVAWIFTIRSATDKLENELIDCRIQVQRSIADIHRDRPKLLAETIDAKENRALPDQPNWIHRLHDTAERCSVLSNAESLAEYKEDLRFSVQQIDSWNREALAWRRRTVELDEASAAGFKNLYRHLQSLKTLVDQQQGVKRLETVLALRRKLNSDPQIDSLRVLVSDAMSLSQSSNISSDLTELQLSVTRLESESDLDRLSDQGKNRVRPRLLRIRATVQGTSLEPLVDSISASLFSEFNSDASLGLGVYDLHVALLKSRQRRDVLDQECSQCISSLNMQRADLDRASVRVADQFSAQFMTSVGTVWCVVVLAAIACSITFWVLTKHVSNHVTNQVEKLDLIASELRIEKSSLTETQRQLQRELEDHERTQIERERLFNDLATASRQAGMVEVANGVLHNVGNILNSINVSTDIIGRKLKESRVKSLQQITDLIESQKHSLGQFFDSDPRGVKLPGYIRLTAQTLSQENVALQSEVAGLRKNVDHVKRTINMQQSMAQVSSAQESVHLAELIADAITIDSASRSAAHVEIDTQISPLLEIVTDKHRVLQILVNLIKNAKEAASGIPNGRVEISLTKIANDAQEVRVSDNGVGIAAVNLQKMFTHGFTTKKNGHGFGLHSASLAARSLGGCLSVTSDGIDRGATFTLTLPKQNEQQCAEGNDSVAHQTSELGVPPVLVDQQLTSNIQNA